MKKEYIKSERGFTVVELLVGIGILGMVLVLVSTFQKDVFSLNSSLQGNLNAQLDARHIVKVMVAELRKTSPSELGAYPIAIASSTAVTFYSDVDSDGLKDKVRYFVSGDELRRGVVPPTGNPIVYLDANEKFSTVVSGFVASTTLPLFQYFPSSYDGTTAPLVSPININSVRLIKITVIIDKNPGQSPRQIIVTSQVSLRNLKDNL